MKVKRLKIIVIILVIQISGFYLIYKNVVQPPVSIEDVKSDYNHSVMHIPLSAEYAPEHRNVRTFQSQPKTETLIETNRCLEFSFC